MTMLLTAAYHNMIDDCDHPCAGYKPVGGPGLCLLRNHGFRDGLDLKGGAHGMGDHVVPALGSANGALLLELHGQQFPMKGMLPANNGPTVLSLPHE